MKLERLEIDAGPLCFRCARSRLLLVTFGSPFELRRRRVLWYIAHDRWIGFAFAGEICADLGPSLYCIRIRLACEDHIKHTLRSSGSRPRFACIASRATASDRLRPASGDNSVLSSSIGSLLIAAADSVKCGPGLDAVTGDIGVSLPRSMSV